ncbi:hypothetical protein O3Q52_22135 [Streptomyces sp. ActVer]|uniref:hypothetical protein n=1 Tax=Streptomyces sp. ActVer TaxID=3014558 RepID=UPI0022B45D0B|nr:hypothetical protein [Streptomyces sp. ActVer]MCZ4510839.1 hypothetical protein [Streptomyces sp. ActVer]
MNLLIGLVVLGTVAGGRLHQSRLGKADGTAAPPAEGGKQPPSVLPQPGGAR